MLDRRQLQSCGNESCTFIGTDGYLIQGEPIPAGELLTHDYPPAPHVLIGPNVLDAGGSMVLAAPAKAFKTAFLLNLAVSLACGLPFVDPLVIPSAIRVLYVNLEVSPRRFQERLRKLEEAFSSEGREVGPLRDALVSWTPMATQRPRLDKPDGLYPLQRAIEEHEPDVIILDPLRRLHSRDENSSQEMAAVFEALDALSDLGPAIIVSHHTGKPGLESRSRVGQHSPRGTSDFEGWPDTLMWFERGPPRTFNVGSILRNGEPVEFTFTVPEGGLLIESAARASTTAVTQRARASNEVVAALAGGKVVRRPLLVQEVVARLGCGEGTVKAAITALRDRGVIDAEDVKEGGYRVQYLRLSGAVEEREEYVSHIPVVTGHQSF